MDIDPAWPEWVLRQDFACVWVRAPCAVAAVEIAANRLQNVRGWKVGPGADQEVFRGDEYRNHARWGVQTPWGTEVEMHARWLRHAATLPAVVAGAWYGVEQGSRGALVLAGAGALAWLIWPESSRLLAWRRRRRTEGARARAERAMSRADRDVAKAERARERANRLPSSARRARRAERLEKRALWAVAMAAREKERAEV